MKLSKHSWKDKDGRVFVDCSECERGGNGKAVDKCSCGWQKKRGRQGGCYLGTLMYGYTAKTRGEVANDLG
jgi:hypothetical protein